ncbi:MAG: hypothetical protein KAU06_06845 [Candidatus Marinimicrobia bacterium]|nr:hypothetical protein [Candidatus Neomarinimicrobiota bacterium]
MSSQVLSISTDPEGRNVTLHRHTFYGHILKNHPQPYIKQESIQSTIENPKHIKESETVENSLIYVSSTTDSKDFNVTTKFDSDLKSGYVTSAYVSKKPKKGSIIWPKSL